MKKLYVIFVIFFSLPAFGLDTEVTIFVEDAYKPFSFKQNGKAAGAYMDVLRAAFSRMKGFKVKITCMFRGREMEHQDLGFDVIRRAVADLQHIGTSDSEPRMAGRNITLIMAPLPPNKRKLKYNEPPGES